jgi:hypothetical protein
MTKAAMIATSTSSAVAPIAKRARTRCFLSAGKKDMGDLKPDFFLDLSGHITNAPWN